MAFLICKRCKAGVHVDAIPLELRIELGWVNGKHRPGDCDGDTEVVGDQEAGVGPGYKPRTMGDN